MIRSLLPIACCVAVAATRSLPAQYGIELDVRGGSVPGSGDIDLYLGPLLGVGFVLIGVDSGPTPLALLDPADSRVLRIGPTMPDVYFPLFGLDQHARLGPFTIPPNPA